MTVVASDLKILVVEDTPSILQMVKSQLRGFGFKENLLGAVDVPNARRILDEAAAEGKPVQFVISDWNMPGETGLDLLKYTRSLPVYENIPFIMLTTVNEQENILQAIEAGADNYLLKPWKINDLKEKVLQVLKKKK